MHPLSLAHKLPEYLPNVNNVKHKMESVYQAVQLMNLITACTHSTYLFMYCGDTSIQIQRCDIEMKWQKTY